jgi:hypothetical protein
MPLRLISKNESLKTSIQALVVAMPVIFNQTVIVMFLFTIFAIIGVNLLKGRYGYCRIDHSSLTDYQIRTLIDSREDCINYGGDWDQHYFNFNNLG